MTGVLLDAFRHNSWATKELIAYCRGLPAEHLSSPGVGTYGGILATFNHIVLADARYAWRLTGRSAKWVHERDESADLDGIEARAEETERLWEDFLAGAPDAERVLVLDEGKYETHAGVIIAQALHHGSAHREQICAIITGSGREPPDVQVWAYADATGRGRQRS